jgi:hypothetical protein
MEHWRVCISLQNHEPDLYDLIYGIVQYVMVEVDEDLVQTVDEQLEDEEERKQAIDQTEFGHVCLQPFMESEEFFFENVE